MYKRQNREFLTGVTRRCHEKGSRVSVFVDPVAEMVAGAKACGADRVELYTEASDKRLAALIDNEGCRGYGMYLRIIEMLCAQPDRKLSFSQLNIISRKGYKWCRIMPVWTG